MFSIFECKEISINAPLKIHKNKLSKISKIRTQFRWSLLVLSFGTDFMTMELNSACAGIKKCENHCLRNKLSQISFPWQPLKYIDRRFVNKHLNI